MDRKGVIKALRIFLWITNHMISLNSARYGRQGASHTPARNCAVTANLDISNKSTNQNTTIHRIEPRECLAVTFATRLYRSKPYSNLAVDPVVASAHGFV